MANINSLMSATSSASSIYGNRNILSGLASGMDTESMIENSVSGFKTKISQLQQQQTKYQWKQDAYRSITDKMYNLSDKYASYTSKTNLFSNAFFNSATTTVASGANADKVSAVGQASSDIQIVAVKAATAAHYTVASSALNYGAQTTGAAITADAADINGQTLSVTFNGVSKDIALSGFTGSGDGLRKDGQTLAGYIQSEIDRQFGAGRVQVSDDNGALSFAAVGERGATSTLSVQGKSVSANNALGLGSNGLSNYLNTNRSIRDLLGDSWFDANKTTLTGSASDLGLHGEADSKAEGGISSTYFRDENGARYEKIDTMNYVRVNERGDSVYQMSINGAMIDVSDNDSLSAVLNKINASDAGVTVSYSQLTKEFSFSAKETGEANNIRFGNGDGADLSEKLFGRIDQNAANYIQGTDAIVTAKVNGGEIISLQRASNTFNVDGMSLTIKGDFNVDTDANGNYAGVSANAESSAVTFSTKTDADKVINTIKSFVDEYNAIMKEVYESYATRPAEKNSKTHAKYEPLTEDDKNGMSEKAIAAYEEKAKQGLLFGDSDLRNLYSQLVDNITPGGADATALKNIGITTSYSSGLTQIKLDEDTLRSALENNPDSVRDTFVKSKETGSASDGLMTKVQKTMEQYASTSMSSPGILVSKAGSSHSPTSLLNNTVQKQIENVQTQIENWQTKMSTKIDYYTRQFTALEKLMSQMNSQSSAMAGLMGGMGG